MKEEYQRVYAQIDLDALIRNVQHIKANMKQGVKLICVIKTDAYGHGAVPVARELEQLEEVSGYAVATAEEALTLRKAGVRKMILILGYTFPYSYKELIREDIRMAVFREDTLMQLAEAVRELEKEGIHKKARVHVKVDTGMSRIGITPDERGLSFVQKLLAVREIEAEGILTHFARADEENKAFTEKQFESFSSFIRLIEKETGHIFAIRHCDNSAGIIELPQDDLDAGRAGIILYGLWPSDVVSREIVELTPVLSLHSSIIYIKEIEKGTPVSYGGTFVADHTMKIATIPVGYGDGYPRGLSGKGEVLIHGKRVRILGRICMDQFMADVSDIEDVKMGDEVILIGRDAGEEITMEELGRLSGRFNYELACCLSKRVPRVYTKEGKVWYIQDNYQDI